jgi:hypothetical protein
VSPGTVAADNSGVRDRVLWREPPHLHARVLYYTLIDLEHILKGGATALCATHLQNKVHLGLGIEPFKFILHVNERLIKHVIGIERHTLYVVS